MRPLTVVVLYMTLCIKLYLTGCQHLHKREEGFGTLRINDLKYIALTKVDMNINSEVLIK